MELSTDAHLPLLDRYARVDRASQAVLFSGGLDSFLAATATPIDSDLIFVVTDAPYAEHDLRAAFKLAEWLKRPLNIVALPISLKRYSTGPIIPHRNLFLQSIVSALGYERIIVAHPLEDLVPDTSPRFLRASSAVLSASLNRRVVLSNALAGESKAGAIARFLRAAPSAEDALSRLAALRLTRSCYGPEDHHCGTCTACFKRWVAFTAQGIRTDFARDPRDQLPSMLANMGRLRGLSWSSRIAKIRPALDLVRALRAAAQRDPEQ